MTRWTPYIAIVALTAYVCGVGVIGLSPWVICHEAGGQSHIESVFSRCCTDNAGTLATCDSEPAIHDFRHESCSVSGMNECGSCTDAPVIRHADHRAYNSRGGPTHRVLELFPRTMATADFLLTGQPALPARVRSHHLPSPSRLLCTTILRC